MRPQCVCERQVCLFKNGNKPPHQERVLPHERHLGAGQHELWLSSWLPEELPVALALWTPLPVLGPSLRNNRIKWGYRCNARRAGSLDLRTINIQGQSPGILRCGAGLCDVGRRQHPWSPHTRSQEQPSSQVVTTKNVSGHYLMSPGDPFPLFHH